MARYRPLEFCLFRQWIGQSVRSTVAIGQSVRSTSAASIMQRKDLDASGFLSNEQKSHWTPMQIGEWLGFVINTMSMHFSVPEKKLNKLKSLLTSAISDGYCSARFLAKIAGSIISCALAVGPISRLLTRQMYFAIETRVSWESTTHFTPALLEELRFWHTNIDCFNGYRIQSSPSSCTILFSDASELAFGGYVATLAGSVVRGMWTSDDLGKSSTHRKLKAIYYVLLSYVNQLQGKSVKIFTDNQPAARIALIGSARLELQQIALQIFQTCIRNTIELDVQWVPRDCNEQADLLSRFVDKDDWAVNISHHRR